MGAGGLAYTWWVAPTWCCRLSTIFRAANYSVPRIVLVPGCHSDGSRHRRNITPNRCHLTKTSPNPTSAPECTLPSFRNTCLEGPGRSLESTSVQREKTDSGCDSSRSSHHWPPHLLFPDSGPQTLTKGAGKRHAS